MTREDFELLEDKLRKEYVRRQSLGGYSADAETLLFLTSAVYEMARHISERIPRSGGGGTITEPPSAPKTNKKAR